MYLRTQQDKFSHASVEAFHFGLWYICRESDDLMVFQIVCNRRITHVREKEEEEERGSHGYTREKEGTRGEDGVF